MNLRSAIAQISPMLEKSNFNFFAVIEETPYE